MRNAWVMETKDGLLGKIRNCSYASRTRIETRRSLLLCFDAGAGIATTRRLPFLDIEAEVREVHGAQLPRGKRNDGLLKRKNP